MKGLFAYYQFPFAQSVARWRWNPSSARFVTEQPKLHTLKTRQLPPIRVPTKDLD